MKETLLIGDFLFVNKMAYGYSYASCPSVMMPRFGIEVDAKDVCGVFDGDNTRLFGSEPERGDVVVFRHPVSGRDYIKRLIGLPGTRFRSPTVWSASMARRSNCVTMVSSKR